MTSEKHLIVLPDRRLRQKSLSVSTINEPIRRIIREMIAISLDWEESRHYEVCVGLAAIQVGITKKIVILRTEKAKDKEFDVLINPRLIRGYGELESDFEGCLSVKDIYGLVPRYPRIKAQAIDESGQSKRFTVQGFRARLLQHEIDHTRGIMFVDHIKGIEDAFFEIKDDGKIERIEYEKVEASGIFR